MTTLGEMTYVVVLQVDDSLEDVSIEHTCSIINEMLGQDESGLNPTIRPLSEIIAC